MNFFLQIELLTLLLTISPMFNVLRAQPTPINILIVGL